MRGLVFAEGFKLTDASSSEVFRYFGYLCACYFGGFRLDGGLCLQRVATFEVTSSHFPNFMLEDHWEHWEKWGCFREMRAENESNSNFFFSVEQ